MQIATKISVKVSMLKYVTIKRTRNKLKCNNLLHNFKYLFIFNRLVTQFVVENCSSTLESINTKPMGPKEAIFFQDRFKS